MNTKLTSKRKHQIMNAAQSLIVSKGYDQSSIDDIVNVSKLSKGAIYWYYNSKKEIYISLIDHWFNTYSQGIEGSINSKKYASTKLKALFNYFIYQFDENPGTFKIMVEFWRMSGLDKDFNKKYQDIYSIFLNTIIEIIELGIKNDEFKKVDAQITALSIMINIEGVHWFTLFEKSGVEAHEYMDTITDFILNGLKKKRKK